MKTDNNKGVRGVILTAIIIMVMAVTYIILSNYVDFTKILKRENINITKTEKEVTITDEGISDSVEKLYDATVIVEVGTSKNKITGWGSGFVYDTDDDYGYILTNHHVVDNADYILIVYTDETTVEGELVGSDEMSDTAVIKVPVDTIKKVAELGKSNDLKLGDTVFAIGTPVSLSYSFTVTRGILSGKDRLCVMSSNDSNSYGYGYGYYPGYALPQNNTWYMSLLQIDATINSGNSGGPLANANGEVVGINNSKLSSSYSSSSIENMGFAIPIEDSLTVAEQLRKNGKVTRPYLGVSVGSIASAANYGIELKDYDVSGALILEIENGSTANKAGLKKGDIITKIGDYDVKDYKYFRYYLYRYHVGDSITIEIIRDGKTKSIDVTLKS